MLGRVSGSKYYSASEARLLEERLVVVHAHAVDAHQLSCYARQARREREFPHRSVPLPKVCDLQQMSGMDVRLMDVRRGIGERGKWAE
jgi:hypothetical protein